jgi:hypothetical protein
LNFPSTWHNAHASGRQAAASRIEIKRAANPFDFGPSYPTGIIFLLTSIVALLNLHFLRHNEYGLGPDAKNRCHLVNQQLEARSKLDQ